MAVVLEDRVNRIYAAVSGIREEDLTKFPPKITDQGGLVHMWQDFRGGMTDADIHNVVYTLVHNIAHTEDHLRKWAEKDDAKRVTIRSSLQSCRPFLILRDLSNADKHGYPPRDGGKSKVAPRLIDVRRTLQISTGAEEGSWAGVVYTPEGPKLEQGGGGTAEVVITGAVVDGKGEQIGDFRDLALEAVQCIEALLGNLGIKQSS